MTRGIIRKNLPLTFERAHELLEYDPLTGALTWRVKGRGNGKGKTAGAVCGPYGQICIDGVNYRTHRVIWLMQTGSWPPALVDHIDGDGTNNAWTNLRNATYAQNAMNKRTGKRNRSGILGVHWLTKRKKWGAEIEAGGKKYRLGCFEAKTDAVKARYAAEKRHFGDFANKSAGYPTDAPE